jgi:putative transcriptional regulator
MGEKRMRIVDVARVTGLNRSTVTQLYYDRKKRFTKDLLDKLCKALDCQPQDILVYMADKEDNCARD